MNLKALTSDRLLSETKNIVNEERRITAKFIELLAEINQRLLFLKLGYASLFEFVTKELGLSEGAAQRRIQTMRLVTDLPETRQAFENGSLSLSNAAKLQSYFHATKKAGKAKTIEEKKVIAKNAENRSQSQCDRMLFELSPELPTPEKTRVLSPTVRELKFSVSEELFEKINRLRDLLSHSHPNATLAELMDFLVTSHLTKMEKAKGLQSRKAQAPDQVSDRSEQAPGGNSGDNLADNFTDKIVGKVVYGVTDKTTDRNTNKSGENEKGKTSENLKISGAEINAKLDAKSDQIHLFHTAKKMLPAGIRVALPVQMKRQVWTKAEGRCEFVNQGRRCSSRYQLEIDHTQPLALGGSNESSNLKLLCKRHNGLAAIQALGSAKMISMRTRGSP